MAIMNGAGPHRAADGVVVVAAAVLRDGRLLAVRRTAPPALAGRWEFPGGKLEPGETEPAALARECREELGIGVRVGSRVGPDVELPSGAVLRLYAVTTDDEPRLTEHDAARWLAPAELGGVPWIEADLGLVAVVGELLRVASADDRGGSAA